MSRLARITHEDGALILPARTPYERELLFESVEFYAKRCGQVRLDVARRHWVVASNDDHEVATTRVCAECGAPLGGLRYSCRRRNVCMKCAKKAIGRRPSVTWAPSTF